MKFLLSILLLLNFVSFVFGQNNSDAQSIRQQEADLRNQERLRAEERARVDGAFQSLRNLENNARGAGTSDFFSNRYIFEPRLSGAQQALVTPTKAEISNYKEFLKQSKTGAFKILFGIDCGNKLVVDAKNEKCFDLSNQVLSYYSFRKRLYGDYAWADLHYQENQLSVGFEKFTIGLIGGIDNLSLEDLSKNSPEITLLTGLSMPREARQINQRKEEIKNGINLNGKIYADKTEAKINQVYLLRSFSYNTAARKLNDRRIDIVVAFKIIGIDADNNLTIIWKELYKGNTHKI